MQTYYITRGRLIPILGAGILSCVLYTPASAMCPGPNFFAAATSYPTGANPTYVATGDFNGDGKADLVVADSYVSSGGAGSAIAVLLGHGNGSFDAPVLYPCVSRPRSIATGDFNGDAITDLAVTNQGAPYVSVFLGLGSGGVGNGTFASAVAYAAGAGPFHIRAADLNQDGITDLVVSNNSVAAVTVLVGQGKDVAAIVELRAAGASEYLLSRAGVDEPLFAGRALDERAKHDRARRQIDARS